MILVILSCVAPTDIRSNAEWPESQVNKGTPGRRRTLNITVKLYSDLRVYLGDRPDPFEIALPDRADVATLIRTLGIDPEKHEIIVGIKRRIGPFGLVPSKMAMKSCWSLQCRAASASEK